MRSSPRGSRRSPGSRTSEVRSEKSEATKSEGWKLVKPDGERRTTNAERRTDANDERAPRRPPPLAAEKEAAREAAEKKKHEAAVKAAEADLARVDAAERKARETWERAHDDLLAARQALTDLRRTRFRSS